MKWMLSGGWTAFVPGLAKQGAAGFRVWISLRTHELSENCASRHLVFVKLRSWSDSSRSRQR